MSKCELTIVLDRADRRYRLGETVTGRVEVRVDQNCRCNGLSLTLQWRTHGRGDCSAGPAKQQGLFRGEWRAGEVHSYPFELTLPPGPVSYHGHYVNVDYYLTARADIPWAFDPKAETDFLVELGSDPTVFDAGVYRGGLHDHPDIMKYVNYAVAGGGACFMVCGLIVLLVVMLGGAKSSQETIIGILFGLVFAAAGGLVAFLGLRNTLAQRKLGPVKIAVKPDRCAPGERVQITVAFSPRADIALNKVTAALSGMEHATSGSGTRRRHITRTLYKEALTLAGGRRLRSREAVRLEGDFIVPHDAPYSFMAGDNQVAGGVEVHIDIAFWPDWTHTVPLVVEPGGAGQAARGAGQSAAVPPPRVREEVVEAQIVGPGARRTPPRRR